MPFDLWLADVMVQQSHTGGLAAGGSALLLETGDAANPSVIKTDGGEGFWGLVLALQSQQSHRDLGSFIAKTSRPWGKGWTRHTEHPRQRLTHRWRNFGWWGGCLM